MLNPAFKNELSLLRKSLKLINKPRHADTSGLLHSFKEPSLAMRPNRTHPVVRSLTARWEVCKHCTSWNIPKQRGSDDISLPSTSQFHNCTKCLVYASFSTHFVVYRLFFKAPRRRIFTFTDYTFPAPTLSSSLWGSERLVLDQLISYRRSPPSCQSQPWCSGYGCFHTHPFFFPVSGFCLEDAPSGPDCLPLVSECCEASVAPRISCCFFCRWVIHAPRS